MLYKLFFRGGKWYLHDYPLQDQSIYLVDRALTAQTFSTGKLRVAWRSGTPICAIGVEGDAHFAIHPDGGVGVWRCGDAPAANADITGEGPSKCPLHEICRAWEPGRVCVFDPTCVVEENNAICPLEKYFRSEEEKLSQPREKVVDSASYPKWARDNAWLRVHDSSSYDENDPDNDEPEIEGSDLEY